MKHIKIEYPKTNIENYKAYNFQMTDYGAFMVWCAENKKKPTPENFVEFIKE